MKKLYIDNNASITSMLVFDHKGVDFLILGFSDINPCI